MNIEELRTICKKFPGVTEDIKWENHLCFCVNDKMFLVLGMDNVPVTASFKTNPEDFEMLSGRKGFKPAPYLARYQWIYTDDISLMGMKEWEHYASEAFRLIGEKNKKKTTASKSNPKSGAVTKSAAKKKAIKKKIKASPVEKRTKKAAAKKSKARAKK
jgi:predicted DNA-binding protein (MmcQ/YjbR family)